MPVQPPLSSASFRSCSAFFLSSCSALSIISSVTGSLKVIKSELENDPFDEEENYTGFKTSKQHKKNKEDFESDSDDDGRKKDREYGWNFIRK